MSKSKQRKGNLPCLLLLIALVLAVAWFQTTIELPYRRHVQRLATIQAMLIEERTYPYGTPTP